MYESRTAPSQDESTKQISSLPMVPTPADRVYRAVDEFCRDPSMNNEALLRHLFARDGRIGRALTSSIETNTKCGKRQIAEDQSEQVASIIHTWYEAFSLLPDELFYMVFQPSLITNSQGESPPSFKRNFTEVKSNGHR